MKRALRSISLVLFVAVCALVLCATWASADGETPQYTRLTELQHKRIGTVLGTTYDVDVWNLLDYDPEFMYFSDMSEMIVALKTNRIDACCLDDPVAHIAVERNDQIAIMPEDAGFDDNAIAMPKGSPIAKQVSDIINKFKQDGTLDVLEEEWCDSYETERELPKMDWPGHNGTLLCAVDDATEPMSYRDKSGNLTGMEVELAMLVARELDMKLHLIPMSFEAGAAALNSKKVDMAIAGISITDERAQAFELSPAYHSAWVRLVTRDTSTDNVSAVSHVGHMMQSTFLKNGHGFMLLNGLVVTILISAVSVLIGTSLGFGMGIVIQAFPKISDLKHLPRHKRLGGTLMAIIRLMALAFEQVMLELPVVIVLLVLQFMVFGLTSMPGLIVAIAGLSFEMAANTSSALRESFDQVEKRYWEVAYSLGYTRWGALRRVVLPIARRYYIPKLNEAIIQTVFDTSIVGLIAVYDMTRMADLVRSRTTEAIPALLTVMLAYFLLSQLLNKTVLSYLSTRSKHQSLIGKTRME